MRPKLFIIAMLALTLSSCTRDILPEPPKQEGNIVTISATIPPETRVAYTNTYTPGSGGTLAWQANDQIILAGYNGDTYIGSSLFTFVTGSTDQFSGTLMDGATPTTVYKAYYNSAGAITLDDDGKIYLPADFWQQTQNGTNSTAHIGKKILLSDTEANLISQRFDLTANSSIIRVNLENLPTAIHSVKKVIWTVETTTGGTRSAILNVSGVIKPTIPGQPFYMNAYLAFDPTVMNIAAGGKVKVTVIGTNGSIEWSKTVAAGMNYVAGNRYTGTVSSWATAQAAFRFTIDITDPTQPYEIWQHSAPSTCPANLTINWGDGASQTINKYASLPNETIASHPYAGAGTYTITIYSDQPDPSNVQMPQIKFNRTNYKNQLLTAVVTPFLNMGAQNFDDCFNNCVQLATIPTDLFRYNTQATSFEGCFSFCSQLTSIPADLFKYNTQATSFEGCFKFCPTLTSIPSNLFKNNVQANSFSNCFKNCKGLTAIPADLFKYNALVNDFNSCFQNCNLISDIPANLFSNNQAATSFSYCFAGCAALTSIPTDLFKNNTNATNFYMCFGVCTGLNSIPADLFRHNTQATYFSNCFTECTGLISIPADLFRYNTQATDFSYCFSGCIKLQLIPEIFPNPATNADFFAGRNMNFHSFFTNVGTAATAQGTAPELWSFNYGAGVTTTDCFTGANVSNAGNIPNNWK